MTAERLLRLYPRAWRDRYGDEFLALAGDEPLSFMHTLDIVSGAIDARLSRTVPASQGAQTPSTSTSGGTDVMNALKARLCETDARFTTLDSLLGAAIVIGVSAAGAILNTALSRAGYEAAGEAILVFAASGGLLISLPFWLTKGQPVRAQAVVVGVPLVLLAAISVMTALK